MFDLERFRRLRDEYGLLRYQETAESLKAEIAKLEERLEHAHPKAQDNADTPGYIRAMIAMKRARIQNLRRLYKELEQQIKEREHE